MQNYVSAEKVNFDQPLSHQEEPELRQTLIYIKQVLRKNLWIIVLSFFFVMCLTSWYLLSTYPLYKSSSTLVIESSQPNVPVFEGLYDIDLSDKDGLQTQLEILKSRELAEDVVTRLNLMDEPEFNGFLPPHPRSIAGLYRRYMGEVEIAQQEPRLVDVVAKIRSKLTVSLVRKTQLLTVSFESFDPDLAAKVSNAYVSAYVDRHQRLIREKSDKAESWMAERLVALKAKLDESENKLIAFKEKHELVSINGDVTSISAKELTIASNKLLDARRELEEKKTEYAQLERLSAGRNNESLETLPVILKNPVITTFKIERSKAQRSLRELSNRYGEKHPKVLKASTRLNTAQDAIDLEILGIVASAKKEFELAKINVGQMDATVNDLKSSINVLSKKSYVLQQYQREAEANRKLYDSFFTRIKSSDEAQSFENTYARVIDHAFPAASPAKPKKALVLALGGILGAALGLLLAFAREQFSDTISGIEDLEKRIKLPLLGAVPLFKIGKKTSEPLSPADVQGSGFSFSEAIKTIRSELSMLPGDEERKVILITSSRPNEGKSTLAMNLAHSYSQLEKTLLIGADLRRPSLAELIPDEHPGLVQLVQDGLPLADCICKNSIDNLDILSHGLRVDSPLEILASNRLKQIISLLREQYDRIIIDCAPVQAVSDAIVLSQYADSIIYAIKSVDTSLTLAERGVRRLQRVGGKIDGIVVTQLDMNKIRSYGGEYYYGGYYDYEHLTDKKEKAFVKAA